MCCSHGASKDDFSLAVTKILEADSASSAAYLDYLVIETSGVSDPSPLVATLDQRWGSMHKVQLESVVAVLDSAAVLEQLATDTIPAALHRQLEWADTILLNKMDLVSSPDAQQQLASWVGSVNCQARLLKCSMGKVALPVLLNVEAPASTAATGHDTSYQQQCWEVVGAPESRRQESPEPRTHAHASEAFQTESMELGDGVLWIGRLCEWVYRAMPAGVLRLKGYAAIAELGGQPMLIQMSGGSRFSFELSNQHAGVHLVLVGERDGWESQVVLPQLRELCGGSCSPCSGVVASAFLPELFEELSPRNAVGGTVVRFEPMRKFGREAGEARSVSGVDLDEANEMLARVVNMSTAPVFVLIVEGIDGAGEPAIGLLVPSQSVGEEVLGALWRVLEDKGEWLLQESFQALTQCACGW
eukprot:TRINITY_DN54344_c0_g1_i1.p1 TRINITY_DN54344_c0_g1~~TRINITY_DN54344_c0_g1_i1.p1  ORF type:complete len:416 (+),score=92.53 TRINITY_DN54344_c0_g1_i1:430-1677(+)